MISSTVHVNTGEYDIHIGTGLLTGAGELASSVHSPCRIGIVTDDNVAPLYLSDLKSSFRNAGFEPFSLILPHGEHTKTIENFSLIINKAAEWGLRRSDMLAALGGGVIGDITGFAASAYMRGIKYIQIPTTLLAAIDSSVGGKTAVNTKAGKNLCGAFYQPSLVITDIEAFGTLPDEIMSDGAAEAIKYGIIKDKSLFESLLRGPDGFDAEYAVKTCVRIKADIVGRDAFDHGERKLLNYGHTIGHGIEKLSDYTIMHGHAVAAGMAVIARSAYAGGICGRNVIDMTETALRAWDLPVSYGWDYRTLAEAAAHDKKMENDSISLLLPREIGHAIIYDLPAEKFVDFITAGEKT